MKRVYLSGKMSGLPNFGVEIFAEAAAKLRAAGYTVFSPAELAEQKPDKPWTEYMKDDLLIMLQWCDAVVVLPNWESSRGARLEMFVAYATGMQVVSLEGALQFGPANLHHCSDLCVVGQPHFDFLCNLVMTDPKSLGKQPAQPEVKANEVEMCRTPFCNHPVTSACPG